MKLGRLFATVGAVSLACAAAFAPREVGTARAAGTWPGGPNGQVANAPDAKAPAVPHCRALLKGGPFGKYMSLRDATTYLVDGHDLLALVNRSPRGSLAPDYAPADLADLRTGRPLASFDCDRGLCLRRDAYDAFVDLRAAMKSDGFVAQVESAYRGFDLQCGVFQQWASISGFCDATLGSAFPGHSQHQLGTVVDVFTDSWVRDPRGAFRPGFGCTPGGTWLRDHAWEFGWVLSYPPIKEDASCEHPERPTHENPLTGFRYEPWHYRFVSKAHAKALHDAQKDNPDLTLEQWLRRRAGLSATPDAPVCDGCNCGACATFDAAEAPCSKSDAAPAQILTPPAD